MSEIYDEYIENHKGNVAKAFEWMEMHIPKYIKAAGYDTKWLTTFAHDASKYSLEEYTAYDAYFYGGNRTYKVVENFNKAWLSHIHKNPHHWQHWIIPGKECMILDMPLNYIIEMICDWWSFSWASGNLYEIFDWYKIHKNKIFLSMSTRQTVEKILSDIKEELDKSKE